jgi:16S rRNA (cytosine1402-N4)-methyltransferase
MISHKPVLLKEAIEALKIRENGKYVDATYGGGGHAREIVSRLIPPGVLIVIDQDADALQDLEDTEVLKPVKGNFRFLKRYLRYLNISGIDGILADLGVSSHQIDVETRGFSYRSNAKLDMRMNRHIPRTAADVLNEFTGKQLVDMFSTNAELRNAKTVARLIVERRDQNPLQNVSDLIDTVENAIRGNRMRYLSQLFQAIRIEVNDELGALRDFLSDVLQVLAPAGRIVIISYHSVEDRLVKNFFKTGNVDGVRQTDEYGNPYRPFKVINRGVITPSQSELSENRRARSARMRIAEKLKDDEQRRHQKLEEGDLPDSEDV